MYIYLSEEEGDSFCRECCIDGYKGRARLKYSKQCSNQMCSTTSYDGNSHPLHMPLFE